MKPAIRIENLGKKYLVSHEQKRGGYRTLRESLVELAQMPLRRLRGENGTSREEFWALKDVSFEVQPGEVVGIIGRNGAGKSTLLKILSRITRPTTGRVELRGRVGSLLEVGTGFHPELTGRENIYLNGSILGMSKREIDKKFDEIVDFAEIEQFLDTPVKRYSSGMYVRLAFAVAAHLEPEILIVDEVLAVGDAGFQKKCLGRIGQVARQGRTVLFVSHNMAAVTQLCQRVIWLRDGRLVASGRSNQVVAQYIASESTQTPQRLWPRAMAPGDDRVRLLAARALQGGGLASVIDINEPLAIEVEFAILKPARNLVTGVSFYDPYGNCLFAHCDWRPNDLAPGHYRKTAIVPPQTFAEGRIDVLVQTVFYQPDVQSAVVPRALTLDACDSQHPHAVRGPYKGTWPGAVRLRLEWTDALREGMPLTPLASETPYSTATFATPS